MVPGKDQVTPPWSIDPSGLLGDRGYSAAHTHLTAVCVSIATYSLLISSGTPDTGLG